MGDGSKDGLREVIIGNCSANRETERLMDKKSETSSVVTTAPASRITRSTLGPKDARERLRDYMNDSVRNLTASSTGNNSEAKLTEEFKAPQTPTGMEVPVQKRARTMTIPILGNFVEKDIETHFVKYVYEQGIKNVGFRMRMFLLVPTFVFSFLAIGTPVTRSVNNTNYWLKISLLVLSFVAWSSVHIFRWDPKKYQLAGIFGDTTAGVLLSFALAIPESKDYFGVIMSYLVAVEILGISLIFRSLVIISWTTVIAAVVTSSIWNQEENTFYSVRRAIALATCNFIFQTYVRKNEQIAREKFSEERRFTKKEAEVNSLRTENKELKVQVWEEMLAMRDLIDIDDKDIGSEAETIQKYLDDLNSMERRNPISVEILEKAKKVFINCGGDVFRPRLRDLSRSSFAGPGEFDPMAEMLESIISHSQPLTRSRRWARVGDEKDTNPIVFRSDPDIPRISDMRRITKSMSEISRFPETDEKRGLNALCDKVDEWGFDIFEVCKLTNNRPLIFTGMALMGKHSLVSRCSIDLKKLNSFLNALERGYNPKILYHNSAHGADVALTANYFVSKSKLYSFMSTIEMLSIIIAALAHDYMHLGRTNAFLIHDDHEFAALYNDISVMENVSISQTFRLLAKEENNILENLSEEDQREVRERVISLILATDLAKHKEHLEKFNIMTATKAKHLVNAKPELRFQLQHMIIKCADLGHACKLTKQHVNWTHRIIEEMFIQGDLEKEKKLPVNRIMDRTANKDMAKSQSMFFELIIVPMYRPLCRHLDLNTPVLDQLTKNVKYWKQKRKSRRSEMTKRAPHRPRRSS